MYQLKYNPHNVNYNLETKYQVAYLVLVLLLENEYARYQLLTPFTPKLIALFATELPLMFDLFEVLT